MVRGHLLCALLHHESWICSGVVFLFKVFRAINSKTLNPKLYVFGASLKEFQAKVCRFSLMCFGLGGLGFRVLAPR